MKERRLWRNLMYCMPALASLAGCGGAPALTAPATSIRQAAAVVTKATPNATPKPAPSPTPRPTPVPRPTPTSAGPAPLPAPAVPFDVRGQVLVGGAGSAGITVRAVGAIGAVTGSDATVSGGRGLYSFFLGGGTYTLTAASGTHSVTRLLTVPFGGQTVDNFNLNL